MGYSIHYQDNKKQGRNRRKNWKKIILVLLASVCGVLAWYQLYKSGTLLALETMARAIEQGEALGEAFGAFCLEVLENAQLE